MRHSARPNFTIEYIYFMYSYNQTVQCHFGLWQAVQRHYEILLKWIATKILG
jgi:hypothetical protein